MIGEVDEIVGQSDIMHLFFPLHNLDAHPTYGICWPLIFWGIYNGIVAVEGL